MMTVNGLPKEDAKAHGKVVHNHRGKKVHAPALWITSNAGGKTRMVKIGHWCPICGSKMNDTGRRLQLEAVERLLQE